LASLPASPDPRSRALEGVSSLITLLRRASASAERYVQTLLGWLIGAIAHWPAEDRKTFGRLLARFTTDLTTHLATPEA